MYSIDWKLVLEYLKVVLSWPVLASASGFLFVWRYNEEIGQFLLRLREAKALGVVLTAEQQQADSPVADQAALAATAGDKSELWEFRYLNQFFVLNTQLVLNAFGSDQIKSVADFHRELGQAGIIDPERTNILNVLMLHGLVEGAGPDLKITDKGKRYIAFPERNEMVAIRVQAVRAAIATAEAARTGVLGIAPGTPLALAAAAGSPPGHFGLGLAGAGR